MVRGGERGAGEGRVALRYLLAMVVVFINWKIGTHRWDFFIICKLIYWTIVKASKWINLQMWTLKTAQHLFSVGPFRKMGQVAYAGQWASVRNELKQRLEGVRKWANVWGKSFWDRGNRQSESLRQAGRGLSCHRDSTWGPGMRALSATWGSLAFTLSENRSPRRGWAEAWKQQTAVLKGPLRLPCRQ